MKAFLTWFGAGLGLSLLGASAIVAAAQPSGFERNTDRPGSDLRMIELSAGQDHRVCAQACAEDRACRAWTWVPAGAQRDEGPNCWLKDSAPDRVSASGMISGLRTAASAPGAGHAAPSGNVGRSGAAGGLVLFDGEDFGGDSRRLSGSVRNLDDIGFNDAARSVRAEGRWQICEHAGFEGHCTIVEGEVADLGERLNGSVSSARPVGPR